MRKWSNKLPMGKRTILQGTSQDRKWAIYMHSWCAHSLFHLEVLAYHCTQHIRSLVHPSYSLPEGQVKKNYFLCTLVRSVKYPEKSRISESEMSQLLTINPFVIGTRMLKTKIRAFNFVVHLIGEEGVHKTLPTLKIKKKWH